MLARSSDGGQSWQAAVVPGADSLDFRDVAVLGAQNALLLSAGPGEKSQIFKSEDGGATWRRSYLNIHEKGFLNAMAFWDERRGLAVGDPIDGYPFILRTDDGGKSWTPVDSSALPPMLPGEYGFAASGSNIAVQGRANAWLATGGSAARVFRSSDAGQSWTVSETPMRSGNASSGIFSIAFADSLKGMAVGGDYQAPEKVGNNVIISVDGGRSWQLSDLQRTVSFKSSLVFLGQPGNWLATGTSGSAYTVDNGGSWHYFDRLGYHALAIDRESGMVWATGAGGRFAVGHFAVSRR